MYLILLSGIPASGKTTLRNRFKKEILIVSPDDFIGYTKENPWTPNIAKQAWKNADDLLIESLKQKKNIVFDATLVSPKRRKKYISLGKDYGFKLISICCMAPKELIIKRNASRDEFRRVPNSVIDRMVGSFIPPSKSEGFDHVITYNSHTNNFDGDYDLLVMLKC